MILFVEALSNQKIKKKEDGGREGLAEHRFPWNRGEVERTFRGRHTPDWLHVRRHTLMHKDMFSSLI